MAIFGTCARGRLQWNQQSSSDPTLTPGSSSLWASSQRSRWWSSQGKNGEGGPSSATMKKHCLTTRPYAITRTTAISRRRRGYLHNRQSTTAGLVICCWVVRHVVHHRYQLKLRPQRCGRFCFLYAIGFLKGCNRFQAQEIDCSGMIMVIASLILQPRSMSGGELSP